MTKRYRIMCTDNDILRAGDVIELEEIAEPQEKTLEEKFQEEYSKNHSLQCTLRDNLFKIAHSHFSSYVPKEEVMRVFKGWYKELNKLGYKVSIDDLRTALQSLKTVGEQK